MFVLISTFHLYHAMFFSFPCLVLQVVSDLSSRLHELRLFAAEKGDKNRSCSTGICGMFKTILKKDKPQATCIAGLCQSVVMVYFSKSCWRLQNAAQAQGQNSFREPAPKFVCSSCCPLTAVSDNLHQVFRVLPWSSHLRGI